MEDLQVFRDLVVPRASSFQGTPPFVQPSAINGGLQVHAGKPAAFLRPRRSEKQVRARIFQLEQEQKKWAEERKRLGTQIAVNGKEITLLLWSLRPGSEVEAASQTGEPHDGSAHWPCYPAPTGSGACDNTSVTPEASLYLEEAGTTIPSNQQDITGSPSCLDCEPAPMTGIVTASSAPKSVGQPALQRTNDQEYFPPLKKRKRVFGLYLPQERFMHKSGDDDDATMTNAIDHLVAYSAIETISAPSVPRAKKTNSQALAARLIRMAGKSRPHSKPVCCAEVVPETPASKVKSQRPVSWPRTERWRRSVGLSIKSLRKDLEKLSLNTVELTLPQPSREAPGG